MLLRGLSPNSATVVSLQGRQEFGRPREHVRVVEGAKAAQAAFEQIFGPPPERAAE